MQLESDMRNIAELIAKRKSVAALYDYLSDSARTGCRCLDVLKILIPFAETNRLQRGWKALSPPFGAIFRGLIKRPDDRNGKV